MVLASMTPSTMNADAPGSAAHFRSEAGGNVASTRAYFDAWVPRRFPSSSAARREVSHWSLITVF